MPRGAAILALAAAGWLALGFTTRLTQVPLTGVGGVIDTSDTSSVIDVDYTSDTSASASDGSGSATATAWQADRTLPTLNPEARPAVVVQGSPVVLLAHGADDGSGVASQACHTGRLPGFDRPGVHTVTCTVRDRAGNIAVGRTTYRVISHVGARPTRS